MLYLLKSIRFRIVLIFLICFAGNFQGQSDSKKTVTVVPGKEYEAGWLHRFFFGDHWRDLWTTPIEVPIINLSTFAGGITPSEMGGGQQTKTLRFKSKTGVEYKFRSINKDPSKALPLELRETLASDIMQDQISSANPMAPFIVAPILNALGILQAEPYLCLLPDTEELGIYKKEFGGLLGIMEIHPTEADDEDKSFAGAEKISGTEKLLARLKEHNDETVNAPEYLKARLADIFLGDWDRHIDQWRWARFSSNGKKFWFPIPRDRDQAFAKFDGVFPLFSSMAITQLEHFKEEYSDVEGITWSGRYTDRRFLHLLTKAQWDSVTDFVKNKLTDSLIISSVKQLPEKMFASEGENMIKILKARRDKLDEISNDFYYQNIKYVNIHCSDDDELAEIIRSDNETVLVKIFDYNKNNIPDKEPFYQREFLSDETKEIRLIMNEGDDKAIVKGNVEESITIFVSGDQGKDTMIDESVVNGYLLGFTPITDAEEKTIFMDNGDKTIYSEGPSTKIKTDKYIDTDVVEYPRDWGHDWRFAPWFNYNPDEGIFIGGGAILYEFGFRRRPYVYRMSLTGGYATLAERFRLQYTGEFYPSSGNLRYLLDVKASGLEILNFYGYGNDTKYDEELKDKDYYKIRQQQLYIRPSVDYLLGDNSTLSIAAQLKFTDTDSGPYLYELNTFGIESAPRLSFYAEYLFSARETPEFTTSGTSLLGAVQYFPPLRKDQSAFYKLKGEGRFYFSALKLSTLALKLGVEKIWGRFPFFEAAYLGGQPSLRGYDLNRFAGDAAVYSNLELRLFLFQTKLLFPFYFGVTAMGDAGKVFYNNEYSKHIKSSWGGGIWMSFIRPENVVTFYVAQSPEDFGFFFNFGFLY